MTLIAPLSPEEISIIHKCLLAGAYGPFFDYDYMSSAIGASKEEVKVVADHWPNVDCASDDIQMIVNNVLLNLWGYPHGCEEEWDSYVPVSPDEVMVVRKRFKEYVTQTFNQGKYEAEVWVNIKRVESGDEQSGATLDAVDGQPIAEGETGAWPQKLFGWVAVSLPDKARLSVRSGDGRPFFEMVANGTDLWLRVYPHPRPGEGKGTQPAAKPPYRHQPVSPPLTASELARLLQLGGLICPEFATAITGGDPLAHWRALPGVQIRRVEDGVWEGRVLEITEVVVPPTDTEGKCGQIRRVLLAYDQESQEVHQVVTETLLPDGSLIRRAERHRNRRVNVALPEKMFVADP